MQSDLKTKRTKEGDTFRFKDEGFVLPTTRIQNLSAYKRTSSVPKLNLANGSSFMVNMVSSQNSHKITNKFAKLTEATKLSPRLNLVKDALFSAKSTTDLRSPSSEITGDVRAGQLKDYSSSPISGILVRRSMDDYKKETVQR